MYTLDGHHFDLVEHIWVKQCHSQGQYFSFYVHELCAKEHRGDIYKSTKGSYVV